MPWNTKRVNPMKSSKKEQKTVFPGVQMLIAHKNFPSKIQFLFPRVMPIRKHLGQKTIVLEYPVNTKRALNPLKYKAFRDRPGTKLEYLR